MKEKPTIPLEDHWAPGTLTQNKLISYQLLEAQGKIKIQKAYCSKATDAARIVYLSTGDREQTAAMLKKAYADVIRDQQEEQLTFPQPNLHRAVEIGVIKQGVTT